MLTLGVRLRLSRSRSGSLAMLEAMRLASSRTQTGRLDGSPLAADGLVAVGAPRTTPVAGLTGWVRLHAVQTTGS